MEKEGKRGLRWNTGHRNIKDRRGRKTTAEKEWQESEENQESSSAVQEKWFIREVVAHCAKECQESQELQDAQHMCPPRGRLAGGSLSAKVKAVRKGKEVEIMSTNFFKKPSGRVRRERERSI